MKIIKVIPRLDNKVYVHDADGTIYLYNAQKLVDRFDLLKDKIFCVHLHDNHGEKDEHLIPFEGTIDWEWLMDKLISCDYKGPITMELVYQNHYIEQDMTEFYKKGYEAGQRLEKMMEEKTA